MGIRGLASFFNNNSHLLSDHKLHDTKVIVDGYNLCHVLYYEGHVAHRYGGDYDHYARRVIRYFRILKSCNISPYLIFDGGYEPDDRKFPTILQRGKDRVTSALNGQKILPILAFETFRRVLQEQNIPFVSTRYEADDQIVVLANDWNCPVMSDDSDFYIFDVTAGYIPFSSVNLTVCAYDTETGKEFVLKVKDRPTETQTCYIPVKIYKTSNFVKYYRGLDISLLPLLGTVLGNDIVEGKYLQNFHAALPAHRVSKHQAVTKHHCKIVATIRWLSKVEDIDTGIRECLDMIPRSCQEWIGPLMEKSIESYSCKQSYTHINLRRFFEGHTESSESSGQLQDYNGNILPAWFENGIRKCEIPLYLQNVAVLHRVITNCQIEEMDKASSYVCSQHIRQVMYSIIVRTGNSPALVDIVQSKDQVSPASHVVEYDRDKGNLKKIKIDVLEEIPMVGPVPFLNSVPDLQMTERKLIMMKALCIPGSLESHDKSFDQSELFMVFILSFWLQHATPKVSANHLKSLIFCMIMLQFRRWKWLIETNQEQSLFQEGISASMRDSFVSSSERHKASANAAFDRFFCEVKISTRNPFDLSVVHAYSQFQACLHDAVHLNQLLVCPFPSPHPCLVYDGSFCYNLCQALNDKTDVDVYITHMFGGKSSPILGLFHKFEAAILGLAGEECFADPVWLQQTTKKKKKKKGETRSERVSQAGSDMDESKEEIQNETNDVAACLLDNRFALLNMDDM